MFPACAGMNRSSQAETSPASRVPRMRGDEPAGDWWNARSGMCSPHARG